MHNDFLTKYIVTKKDNSSAIKTTGLVSISILFSERSNHKQKLSQQFSDMDLFIIEFKTFVPFIVKN